MNNPSEIILCQILKDNSVYYKTNLKESDFLDPKNKQIFQTISTVLESGNQADQQTLFQNNRSLDPSHLAKVSSCYPTTANFKQWEAEVKEKATLYHLAKLPAVITDLCRTMKSQEVLEEIEKNLVEITTRTLKDKIYKVGELICDFMTVLEERFKSDETIPGIKTGFSTLDQTIMGFNDRRYYIIAARPSDGKTALMGNMAIHAAVREKVSTGIISAESSRLELLNRFYSSLGKINNKSLQMGLFKESEFKTLTKVSEQLFKSNLFIYDVPNISITELKSQARRMVSVHGIKILFIDYIGIIQNKINAPRNEQIQDISLQLKGLARELNIPIVTLCQIGRKADGRQPIKSDLADSAGIERDADGVVLVHHERNELKEIIQSWFIVDKNRDGDLAVIDVNFAGHYTQFYEGRSRQ